MIYWNLLILSKEVFLCEIRMICIFKTLKFLLDLIDLRPETLLYFSFLFLVLFFKALYLLLEVFNIVFETWNFLVFDSHKLVKSLFVFGKLGYLIFEGSLFGNHVFFLTLHFILEIINVYLELLLDLKSLIGFLTEMWFLMSASYCCICSSYPN